MAPSSNVSTNVTTSVACTVTHAVSFLVSPLTTSYTPVAVTKLQFILKKNFTSLAHCLPTALDCQPLSCTDYLSLTLSPHSLPPHPVYSACVAAGIPWFEWISLLGNSEFDLVLSPGLVTVRTACNAQILIVWAEERWLGRSSYFRSLAHSALGFPVPSSKKTFAQQLVEDDRKEDDQLFAMIADEINAPTWVSPVDQDFPSFSRPLSSLSFSSHSRSSSPSSNSSSDRSHLSLPSFTSSITSLPPRRLSRRERSRHLRVFVDTSKVEVTPYDGGKTTVLTGGVMLGDVQHQSRSKALLTRCDP